MEELITLKEFLHHGKILEALELVEELEEMSNSDKLNKIFGYGIRTYASTSSVEVMVRYARLTQPTNSGGDPLPHPLLIADQKVRRSLKRFSAMTNLCDRTHHPSQLTIPP